MRSCTRCLTCRGLFNIGFLMDYLGYDLDSGRAEGSAYWVMWRPLRGRGVGGGFFPGFRCLFESAQPGVTKEGTPPGFSAGLAEWM